MERYRAGESVYALARAFEITRQTVSIVLERHGVPRRYRVLSSEDVGEAGRFYEQGHALVSVGEQLGVCARTVQNAFAKAGVPTRPVGTNQWRRK